MTNAMTNAPQEGMIGKYRIIASLASGSQGTVHRAYDPTLGREVALKVLHPHLATPELVARFRREAQIVASINHPNIAGISEIGEHNGSHYLAIEYVPHSVGEIVKGGPLDIVHAASIAHQTALALEAARTSRHGITHHDVKPDNLLLTSTDAEGMVKLIDFGIAHAEGMASMTQAGSQWGTPFYMPPEQWRGERGDSRSDVYSLGVVIYQMLSGRVPFDSDAENNLAQQKAIADQHLEAAPAPLRSVREDVPEALEAIVAKCMAKSPADRFQTPGELAAALADMFSLSAPSASLTGARPKVKVSPEPKADRPARQSRPPRPPRASKPTSSSQSPLLDMLPASWRTRRMMISGGIGGLLVILTLIIMASQADESPPPPRIIVVAPPATPTATATRTRTPPAPFYARNLNLAPTAPRSIVSPTPTPVPTAMSAVDFIRSALSETPISPTPTRTRVPVVAPPTRTPAPPTRTPTPDNPYARADLRLAEESFHWTPQNPSVGDWVAFGITVRNDGSRDAPASTLAYSIDSAGGANSGEVEIPRIPAGHSADATFSWRAEAGFHNVALQADAGDDVHELSENNNVPGVALIYHGTALADLEIVSLGWSPTNPQLGREVTFTATVRNRGEGRASESVLTLSVEGENGVSDTLSLPPMESGGTASASATWRAAAGAHTVIAVADPDLSVPETNEGNNEFASTYNATTFVDLSVESVTWTPEKPSVGDSVTFSVTVANGGNLDAGETVVVLANTPNDIESTLPGVPAGESRVVEFEWTAEPETLNLVAVAELNENEDAEIDLVNNAIEKTYDATALPDLVVASVAWEPENPALGDEVIITATIENRGEGRASGASAEYQIRRGNSLTEGGRREIPKVDAGGSEKITYAWPAEKGARTFQVQVNSPRTIIETDYDNNGATADYDNTRLANLIVESATWTPENPAAGDEVTFSATVRNAGEADAPAFQVGFRDANRGERLDDYDFPGGMSAGASSTATFQWRAQPGEYDFAVRADSSNDVDESNEEDNLREFAYNATRTADLYIQDIQWNPQYPSLGQEATVSAILANRGEVAAGESAVRFVIDGPHRSERYLDMPALAPGDAATRSFAWTARLGRFTFTATADANNQVPETDENNNTLVNNYNDTAQPDLVVAEIGIRPSSPNAGQEFRVWALIKNVGSGDAGRSSAALYINGSLFGTTRVSALNAGEVDRVYFAERKWADGRIAFRAVADSAGEVSEGSETNNELQVTWD